MGTTPAEIEQEDAGTSTKDDSNTGAASAPEIDPKHEAQLAFLAGEEDTATEGEQGDEPDTAAPAAEGSKDPVEAVLSHLAGDKPEQTEPAATAEEKTKEPTAAEVVAQDQAAKGDKPAATEAKPIADEPAGLDEVEKAIKGKAQKAFVELRKEGKQLRERLKAQTEEVAKEREWAEHGRGFVGIFKERGGVDDLAAINDDQHVGVVRIQAALNRVAQAQAKGEQPAAADSAVIEEAYTRLQPMVKAKPAAAATLEPFTGELPAAQRELVDSGLIEEADARLLLAAKALQAKAKEVAAKPAPPAAAPAPAPAARPAAPAAPPAARQEASGPTAEQQAHAKAVADYLIQAGVPETSIRSHFVAKIQPELISQLQDTATKTGTDPLDLFYRLSPQAQFKLVQLAQSKIAEAAKPPATVPGAGQVPAVKTPRPKGPLFQNALGRGNRARVTTSANPAEATQAFLAGE